MNLSNVHTHSVFCDGKDTIEHMAEKAYKLGFVSLGFSSHGRQTNNDFALSSEEGYRDEVRRVAKEYEGRMKIWLGIEQDYYGICGIKYDFRLGAVHYLDDPDGREHPIDHSLESFEEMLRVGFKGDYIAMAEAYFERVALMAERNNPDVIAHYDLIRKYNENNRFFDENDPAYQAIARRALDRAYAPGRLMEVNTGAMARKWRTVPYLSTELLAHWRELGGGVILGSDCHDAEVLTAGFDKAVRMIQEAGYKTIWRLGTGNELFEEEDI